MNRWATALGLSTAVMGGAAAAQEAPQGDDAARALAVAAKAKGDEGKLVECGAGYRQAFAHSPQEIYLWNAASCLLRAAGAVDEDVGPDTADAGVRGQARLVFQQAQTTLEEYLGTFPAGRKRAEAEAGLASLKARLVGTLAVDCDRDAVTLRIRNPAGGVAVVRCPARVERTPPGDYAVEAAAPGLPHVYSTGRVSALESTRLSLRFPASEAAAVAPPPESPPAPAPATEAPPDEGSGPPAPHVRLLLGAGAHDLGGHGDRSNTAALFAPAGGVEIGWAPIEALEVAAGLAYQQLGADIRTYTYTETNVPLERVAHTIRGHSVAVPVLLRGRLTAPAARGFATVGVAPAYHFGLAEHGGGDVALDDRARAFGLSVVAGLGGALALGDRFYSAELRYGRGLVPFNAEGSASLFTRDFVLLLGVDVN